MTLTPEQELIIQSNGNIKINAVAGSGKTTTVIEYAASRPKSSKILYLVFNKSVKQEAVKRFENKQLFNVTVETAHSLAFKSVMRQHNYKIRPSGFKTYEIAQLLGLQGDGEKHGEFIIANHINKFISYFCNSDKQKVQDLNYLDLVSDPKSKAFVTKFYSYIEKQTRVLLGQMDKGTIDITHDFYLKKFQLAQPQLNFDYILFDEGQDSSAAMLDIFLKQKAIKVIVGDTHQQIYGWRHAVNSLEKVEFKTFHLSTSFRFSQDIANLATGILDWKNHLKPSEPVLITGKGSSTTLKTKAVIARTNLGLLLKAIYYATEKGKLKTIYFEGNINSYTYADQGASLYDVLNLHNGNKRQIRDKLIGSMKNMADLEDYIENTEDGQLSILVEIVKEYGNKIHGILEEIKAKHVSDDDKEKAQMVFSTVHRCKGMEYDSIELASDFLTEEKLEKLKKDATEHSAIAKLNEEINLLYVAVTRTKNSIHIHESFLPAEFPPSPHIHLLKTEVADTKKSFEKKPASGKSEKTYSIAEARETNKDAYKTWSTDEDIELTDMFHDGVRLKDLASHFGRTTGAVGSRIKKLQLENNW